MSRLSSLFLIVFLIAALLVPTSSAFSSGLDSPSGASELICGSPTTVRLLTDQNVNAGTVTIENGETSLFVTYTTNSSYKLTATHLAVVNSLAGIPKTNKGNPIPGQFPYQSNHNKISTFTYTIPLSGLNSTVIIAAHADVLKTGATKTQGAWGEGTMFNPKQRSWGMYFSYSIQPCDQPPAAVNDSASVAEDSAATSINVLANDSDPDGDPFTIASASDPAHGTVVVAGDGLSLTYQPDANYCNDGSPTDTFTYSLDPGGSTATVAVTVTCVDDMPVALDDASSVAEGAGPTVVDVLANDSDADGDPFTIASASDPANGTVVVAGDGLSLTYQPDGGYCNNGSPTDDFTYSLTPGGSTATVSVTVTCVDDEPTAINDAATVDEDSGANTINVLANDFDPDGGSISIASVTQPANGTVVITNGGANLTYQPNANYCNAGILTDDFTYTLDPGGSTATVAVTVTCVDDPPTAVDDSATVDEDASATTINVLANDTDIDGGVNSIASVTQPANGTVVITNGGADLTYQPNVNYCNDGGAADTFTYTLTPGSSSATVSVTVTCINDAPSFDLPVSPNQSVVQDSGAQTVSGFATNISAGPANESGQALTFSVTNDNNALFSTQPDIDETSGDLTYTPANGATGSATVTVSLMDDGGTANGGVDTSAPQLFTITVTPPNAAPVALDQSVSTNEDTSKTITLSATDAEGNTLSFIIVDTPDNGSLGSLGLVNCAANTCTVDVDYTPAADFNGSDSFTFKANDGATDSNIATVSITVDALNDAPSFTSGGNVTVAEDSGAYSAAWATGISAGPADESGQTFSFIIQNNNNPSLFSVAPAIASDGTLSFTVAADASGTATLSVVLQDNGGTANGGVDTSAPVNFDIIVTGVNDAPVNTVPAAENVNEDTDLVFSVGNGNPLSVADVDAGANNIQVTVSALNGTITPVASGATISGSGTSSATITGTLTQVNGALNGLKYTGNANFNSTRGTETLTIVTNDQGNTGSGGALSDTDTVDITVNAVNDAPTALAKNFNAQANMKITGLTGLLTGATDPDTGDGGYTATFTVDPAVSVTSPAGGVISNLNTSTGTFDFDPPPGATGNVTFTYKVCDSGNPGPSACSAPATVTVAVAGPVIWFVNPAAGVNGNGNLSSPFNNLASAAAVDASGHRIFIYTGTTPVASITLNSNEWLIGQGVSGSTFDALFSITPPTGTIARPSINGTRPVVQGNVAMATDDIVRGLNIQPASGTAGLTASGATSLTVNEVTVITSNAVAVSLLNSDGTFSFTRIDAIGGSNGIVWNNASPATGSFTVIGDGTNTSVGGNGTGGIIANMSGSDGTTNGIGIYLNNARNVTLRRMHINGTNQNYGIRGNLVNGFTLEYSTVDGTNGTAFSLPAPNNAGEGSIYFGDASTTGLTGSATFTNVQISGGRARNFSVINHSGTLNRLTITGSTFGLNQNFSNANDSLSLEARNSGTILNVTVTGSTFLGAPGDLAEFVGQQLTTMDVVFQNNTLTNSHAQNIVGGGGLTLATAGTMTFNVTGNTMRGADGSAVTLFKAGALSGTPSMSGVFSNNTIGVNGVAGSGSKTGNGIFVSAGGTGTMSYTLANNTILQYLGNAAIYADNTGGSYTANFTITGNTAAQPGGGVFAGLAITNGAPSSADTINVCADIKNNNFSAAEPSNSNDIIVGASGAGAGHTFNLPGYAGGANLANVQTFIQNNNLNPGTTVVTAYTDAPATAAAFTGIGTTCPTP